MRSIIVSGFLFVVFSIAHAGAIYVPGFRTYQSSDYLSAERNVLLLKDLKTSLRPFRISRVNAANPGDNYHLCRGSYPLYSLGKKPYEIVLADALAQELNSAGLYSEIDSVPISVFLNIFDFSSSGSANWIIEAIFTVPSHEPIKISHTFSFTVGFGASQACSDVNFAQHRALQEFLHVLYTNPQFRDAGKKEPIEAPAKASDN